LDIVKYSEKAMSMSDEAWSRHANPWSVYSRFSTLPLMSLAFWSREWIGVYAIVAVALSVLWIWLNPRVFGPPKTTDNWASMGTFGERIYLNRKKAPLPKHHTATCRLLQILSAAGLPFFIYGLYTLNFWIVILGNFWIMVFKAWFVDRMVWLYLDMKDTDERYQSWYIPSGIDNAKQTTNQ